MSKFTRLKTVESLLYSTEVVFTHFLSGPFTTEAIMNLLDKKLANPTSVQCQFFLNIHCFLDCTFKSLKGLFGFKGILPTLDYESSADLLN